MKRKLFVIIMSLSLIVILSFCLVGCSKDTEVDEDGVLYFSDYQAKPKDPNALKGSNYQTIDFVKDSPIDIVKKATENSADSKQSSRMVITNSTISSEPDKGLDELRQIVQRSTYLETHNSRGVYNQIISGMLNLETNSDALNSIVDAIIGSFGYCTRSYTLDGQSYSSSGKSPKFTTSEETVTRPGGASCKWSKWSANYNTAPAASPVADNRISDEQINELIADFKQGKYEIVQDDAGGFKVIDPITGNAANAIKTVSPFDNKDFAQGIYLTEGSQYQMDSTVIDVNKSSKEYKKSDGYYEIKLVYKRGKSAQPDFYDSIIDQACRVAGGMLLVDTNNTPLKIGRIKYTDLSMVYQIWESGFIKSVVREEEMKVIADFNVVVKKGTGLGSSVNLCNEIYSYSDKDTDVEFLKDGKDFTEYGK